MINYVILLLKDRETQRPPTTTAEPKSEQLPEQLPEQEHVILAEQHVEGSSENQTEVKQSTVEPRRAAELSENKPATRTETENRAESEDTVPQLGELDSWMLCQVATVPLNDF